MFKIGILIGSDKYSKNWSICSRNKGQRAKNRFVADDAFFEYQDYKKRKLHLQSK